MDEIAGPELEDSQTEPPKPGLLSQLVPYIFVGFIFYWVSGQTDWMDVWAKLEHADLRWFVPSMLLFILFFFPADCLCFGLAYKWFNRAKVSPLDVMKARGGPLLVQIVSSPLAEAFYPLYLKRNNGIPFFKAVSSHLFVTFNNTYAVIGAISAAIIYGHFIRMNKIDFIWQVVIMLAWVFLFIHLLYWRTGLKYRFIPWLRRRNLALTFDQGRLVHYTIFFLIRLGMLFVTLFSNYIALRAVGVNPPLSVTALAVPLIVTSIFLPISVAGQGGPQALALLFFVGSVPEADPAAVVAYATLWTTCFTLGRIFWGLIFIRGFWKGAFPQGLKSWGKQSG